MGIKQKVREIETGMAKIGMMVDRQFCRKSKTTKATRASACKQCLHHFFHRDPDDRDRLEGTL